MTRLPVLTPMGIHPADVNGVADQLDPGHSLSAEELADVVVDELWVLLGDP